MTSNGQPGIGFGIFHHTVKHAGAATAAVTSAGHGPRLQAKAALLPQPAPSRVWVSSVGLGTARVWSRDFGCLYKQHECACGAFARLRPRQLLLADNPRLRL